MTRNMVANSLHAPMLLLLTAPSGAGKTTLFQNLMDADAGIQRIVTCTTRNPRAQEIDGQDYHFLTTESFERGILNQEFLEYAQVYDFYYGTRNADISNHFEAGHDVLLNIDVQGAATIRKQADQDPELKSRLVTVFLTPPTPNELENRLRNRNSDTESVIQKRLAHARQEIEEYQHFDYLIVSGTIEEDLRKMQSIVQAERCRPHRVRKPVWAESASEAEHPTASSAP